MESDSFSRSACQTQSSLLPEEHFATCSSYGHEATEYFGQTIFDSYNGDHGDVKVSSDSNSPFYRLRKDSATFVAQTLDRGRKNLWQLTTSRISVLLSCPAVCSTSMHQFLRNYEDLNVFILAGEAFCGMEAVEFRQKLKIVCENYLVAFHRQNICALRMVLEKETWAKMSSESMKAISLAGLVGDGAPLIASSNRPTLSVHSSNISHQTAPGYQKNGFSHWLNITNPFLSKMACSPKESLKAHILSNGSTISCLGDVSIADPFHNESPGECSDGILMNGSSSILEDENEDLLADFIDEDSQLPSRISKPMFARSRSAYWNDEEMISAQTGSSLCLLRLMDKYARLMQKLEVVNVEFFKGICQLFGIFFHFIFETFGQREVHSGGKVPTDSYRLKFALSKITQDCDQWIRHQSVSSSSSSPTSLNTSYAQMDVTPTIPASTIFGHAPSTSFGLKERCAAVEAISLVARVLHRSKPHLQSMLLQHNMAAVEDFFENLVDSVPDLAAHIHKTTSRLLLHINGYADRIANSKWELKDLGIDHNGYIDLLLGEFKHYKTRLEHGGIDKEVQDLLLEYGLENVAEILIEGLSRVKRCTDEGRALMSLDLQVLINGLKHFVSINVRQKLQAVETFIKAYYLPETEYVHWARSHPEYSKSQIVGLVNLVSIMKNWKRKTRLEVLERIEGDT
uniref:Coiled-coil domain-containing protein 132 n=1 Tax=Anthurium amnicola TaxID=1678845 RepID=A0A1D1YUT6_9ARAE